MPKHGTASVISGAYIELQTAVLKALPRDIDDEVALNWASNGEALSRGLKAMLMPEIPQSEPAPVQPPAPQPKAPEFPPVPAVNEPFDLTIDGDLDITPTGWTALPSEFPKGKRTSRCRLLDLGHCANRDDAVRKAAKKAQELKLKLQLAPGQAREAFMAAYPRHNSRPIVMGGNEWQDSSRGRLVACLGFWNGSRWNPRFLWSDIGFVEVCLWLVVGQDA